MASSGKNITVVFRKIAACLGAACSEKRTHYLKTFIKLVFG